MSRAKPRRPCAPLADLTAGAQHAERSRGQALVEFAFVLAPILLILVAIVQFGFLFGANVTLTNAAHEGARAGTIYVYDQTHTKAWNDAARCGVIAQAATQSFGMLTPSTPNFTVTLSGNTCPTPVGDSLTDGDLKVSYCASVSQPDGPCPDAGDSATTCAPDTREGCLVQVEVVYHSDIIVPLIGTFLSSDGQGRFAQRVIATMVVN
jgi:Flp pilus assembly protein TadG